MITVKRTWYLAFRQYPSWVGLTLSPSGGLRFSAGSLLHVIIVCKSFCCRSQWQRGLRRRSAAARLLRLWVRIPPGALMIVSCECCVLSGRGLCDALITRPEESYRLWCVVVCDLETSWMRRPWPALGRSATKKKVILLVCNRPVQWTN